MERLICAAEYCVVLVQTLIAAEQMLGGRGMLSRPDVLDFGSMPSLRLLDLEQLLDPLARQGGQWWHRAALREHNWMPKVLS